MTSNYDLIVIGSGPGGYVAAIRASQLGLKTAIVERENLGGVCLNWGCIPTKALLKSAQVFDYIKHAENYGIKVGKSDADFGRIISRSRGVAENMSKGVQFLMRKNKIDILNGHGRFLSSSKIGVENSEGKVTEYQAKNFIVATGGRSRNLPNMPIDEKKIIGYRQALTLQKKPKTMIVVGAGAIGVEFAYFYHSIGTKVTVVEFMEQGLLPREDKDVSKELGRIYKKMGIEVLINTSVESVDTKGKACKVLVKNRKTGKEDTIIADMVLSAAGITPNTQDVGLDKAGVNIDGSHITVDDYYQTNVKGIYAIGDVLKNQALAHVASAEGITCVEKIAGQNPMPMDYNNIPGCTYCIPEVASVGYTEEAAKAAGYQLKVGKFPFSASGKAQAAGAASGFVKIIFDAKYGELLGAHMVGLNVTEMIAEIVAARKLETTGHEMLKTVHPHPTMSEAVLEATAAAYDEVIHL